MIYLKQYVLGAFFPFGTCNLYWLLPSQLSASTFDEITFEHSNVQKLSKICHSRKLSSSLSNDMRVIGCKSFTRRFEPVVVPVKCLRRRNDYVWRMRLEHNQNPVYSLTHLFAAKKFQTKSINIFFSLLLSVCLRVQYSKIQITANGFRFFVVVLYSVPSSIHRSTNTFAVIINFSRSTNRDNVCT